MMHKEAVVWLAIAILLGGVVYWYHHKKIASSTKHSAETADVLQPEHSEKVRELTNENHDELVNSANKPVIIDAFATWCPPCRMMKPRFHELAEELSEQYLFLSMDVDKTRELADKYDVQSLPTFICIDKGVVKEKIVGGMSTEALKKKIQSIFA